MKRRESFGPGRGPRFTYRRRRCGLRTARRFPLRFGGGAACRAPPPASVSGPEVVDDRLAPAGAGTGGSAFGPDPSAVRGAAGTAPRRFLPALPAPSLGSGPPTSPSARSPTSRTKPPAPRRRRRPYDRNADVRRSPPPGAGRPRGRDRRGDPYAGDRSLSGARRIRGRAGAGRAHALRRGAPRRGDRARRRDRARRASRASPSACRGSGPRPISARAGSRRSPA